ncbi:restriction endonuclease subunit S [Streptomyces sp. NPDC085540]|uniref:restriction endonuclease subunit S n=1 Tax=Streptomyces sp. NPDC085540 TaxID=3365730 RepID=UPI0037CE7FD8
MTPWDVTTVGNVSLVVTKGTTPTSIGRAFTSSGIPFVKVESIQTDGFVDLRKTAFIDEETHASLSRSALQVDDILFTIAGTIGRVAQVTAAVTPGNTNQAVAVIRPDSRIVEPRFVLYCLRDKRRVQKAQSRVVQSVQANLSLSELRAVEIPLPSLQEQRAITSILGALDDKIAVNERIASTYEQLLQYRFTALGLADEPREERAVAVTELVTFNPKRSVPTSESPVYVDMAALQTGRAGIPVWTRRAPKSGPRFMNGDTLLARITPCLENGKTGYVDFMEDDEVGLGSTEFIVMCSRPGVPAELSYFLARDSRFREHAIRNMVGTSGRQRVSAADAANYFVNRPDAEMLASFGEQAEAAFAHMASLQNENRTLAALRDTLLPQLMSGSLRVKGAEKIVEDHV